MSKLSPPIIGYVLADEQGNFLKYDPQKLMWGNGSSVATPCFYDSGQFTVFRNKGDLEQLLPFWEEEFSSLNIKIKPLYGVTEASYSFYLQPMNKE